MDDDRPRIAIVTFTDDRDVGLYSKEVENHLRKRQSELKEFLTNEGVEVVDPLEEIRKRGEVGYGIRNLQDIGRVLSVLLQRSVDAAIIGSWNWSPPMLVMDFVRKLAKPVMYYSENDPLSGSLSQLSAAGASLMEWGGNGYALTHDRCFGDRSELLTWVRAVRAFTRMRESTILLWGGTYAVKMEQLQDDVPRLKSFMVREVLSEDQLVLVSRAEHILRSQRERLDSFIRWITERGLRIVYDSKMVTEESLHKQAALLLAARETGCRN